MLYSEYREDNSLTIPSSDRIIVIRKSALRSALSGIVELIRISRAQTSRGDWEKGSENREDTSVGGKKSLLEVVILDGLFVGVAVCADVIRTSREKLERKCIVWVGVYGGKLWKIFRYCDFSSKIVSR